MVPRRKKHSQRAFELTLKGSMHRLGCMRRVRLTLHTWSKQGEPLATFVHDFPPTHRDSWRPIARLVRQTRWHLLVLNPHQKITAAVEMENTLDLGGLLRYTLQGGDAASHLAK